MAERRGPRRRHKVALTAPSLGPAIRAVRTDGVLNLEPVAPLEPSPPREAIKRPWLPYSAGTLGGMLLQRGTAYPEPFQALISAGAILTIVRR